MSDSSQRDFGIPVYDGVVMLDAPRDPDFKAFLRWWEETTRTRALPSRADFDPAKHRRLLPHVFIMEKQPAPGRYVQRLVGSTVESFYGMRLGGQSLQQSFPGEGADRLARLYDAIGAHRKPCFRMGPTYWYAQKSYRRYEACFFPLSPDGAEVNMIIGAIKFFGAEVLRPPSSRVKSPLEEALETMAPGRGDIRPGAGSAPARGDCADTVRELRPAATWRTPRLPRDARTKRRFAA
jgi:hypothetical protein